MKDFQIGVDIEDIARFELDSERNKNFFEKIFTQQEIAYCLSKTKPAQSFAARFCAKEATIKAFSTIIQLSLDDIEVISTKRVPSLCIHARIPRHYEIRLSLSHTETEAIAFVTLILY